MCVPIPLCCHCRELFTGLEERKAAVAGSPWPVVVIDEANVLMDWKCSHPEELASFLGFLVKTSKQDNRCHVILATSEYAFQAWLTDGERRPQATWRPNSAVANK